MNNEHMTVSGSRFCVPAVRRQPPGRPMARIVAGVVAVAVACAAITVAVLPTLDLIVGLLLAVTSALPAAFLAVAGRRRRAVTYRVVDKRGVRPELPQGRAVFDATSYRGEVTR